MTAASVEVSASGSDQTVSRLGGPRRHLVPLMSGAVICVAGLWLSGSAFEPAGERGLVPDRSVYDVGSVRQGNVPAVFRICNTSDRMIRISQVRTTCRCTEIAIERKTLLPGETASVDCVWDTRGIRGSHSSFFDVFWFFEQPGSEPVSFESLRLAVKGDVIPVFDVSPAELRFRMDTVEERPVRRVVLKPRSGEPPVHVEQAYCTDAAFSATVFPPATVEVAFEPLAWVDVRGVVPELRIETDCPLDREISVPIRVVESGSGSGL